MSGAWLPVDPDNPPALHMVAIYNDGSGAIILTKFDNEPNFMQPEDGWEITPADVRQSFDWWTPAPEGFVPAFMDVTPEDWR